ncbi:MAG: enoyl-CoA hydratase-related protein [Dehalococcoidia bacterium]|nr:enoyl-CoA hydratase-related protein [Dehalococcoidia bacterium]
MIDYSRYTAIKVEKQDRVALVTLNRPEKLNPFDAQLHRELEDILEDMAKDGEVNAVVLTGAGKAFSAGGDLRAMRARLEDSSSAPSVPLGGAYRLINNLVNLEKPIISAVNGDAIGLGATVALFCDVIYAAENARFGDPHVKVGLVAGDGGCVIWPLLIGMSRAKEYLLSGDLMIASEAERIGLINKVLPQDQVVPAAMAFAGRLANGATKAINWTKASLNQYLKQQMNLILYTSLATEYLCMQSKDHKEALDAFLEKRPPRFTGA